MQHHDKLVRMRRRERKKEKHTKKKKDNDNRRASLSSVSFFAISVRVHTRYTVFINRKQKETFIVPNITFIVCLLLKLPTAFCRSNLFKESIIFSCQATVCCCDHQPFRFLRYTCNN